MNKNIGGTQQFLPHLPVEVTYTLVELRKTVGKVSRMPSPPYIPSDGNVNKETNGNQETNPNLNVN